MEGTKNFNPCGNRKDNRVHRGACGFPPVTETQHQKKEDLWTHSGFDEAIIADSKNPTHLELVDCTKFTKDRNKRFRVCQDNSKKAHSLTHRQCNEGMQIRLENNSEFEEKVKGNPFKMMKAIKPKMHDPSKVKCPFVTIFEQLERLLNMKQEEEEVLIEHTKRFKQAQDNAKSIVRDRMVV